LTREREISAFANRRLTIRPSDFGEFDPAARANAFMSAYSTSQHSAELSGTAALSQVPPVIAVATAVDSYADDPETTAGRQLLPEPAIHP